MRRTVLVPLDLGLKADRALPVARRLADRIAADLDVVIVTDAGVGAYAEGDRAEAHQHAEHAGVAIDDVRLRYDDDVATGVLAEAGDETILCVATHAYGPVLDAVAHGVSNDLLRAGKPLVLVGPRAGDRRPTLGEVLVCLGSPRSAADVAAGAARLARLLHAKARVLHVLGLDDIGTDDRVRATDAACATLRAAGVPVASDVVEADSPSDAILAAADRMDGPLIVVGAHGGDRDRIRLGHPPLGDVARRVVHHARHPVLVIPTSRRA